MTTCSFITMLHWHLRRKYVCLLIKQFLCMQKVGWSISIVQPCVSPSANITIRNLLHVTPALLCLACCTVLYTATLFCIKLYWTVLYCTVLYCTARHFPAATCLPCSAWTAYTALINNWKSHNFSVEWGWELSH